MQLSADNHRGKVFTPWLEHATTEHRQRAFYYEGAVHPANSSCIAATIAHSTSSFVLAVSYAVARSFLCYVCTECL